MARHRWTLALILICLPILATVITAFRVRDLPRTPQDSVNKKKCDDCDVANKVYSVKIESDNKNVYEELKKTAREKQQHIYHKEEAKSAHKFVVGSDERDDLDDEEDDSENFVNKIKNFFSFGGDDDEDDIDKSEDEGDDDESLDLIKKTAGKNSNEKIKDPKSSDETVSRITLKRTQESGDHIKDDEKNVADTKKIDLKKSQTLDTKKYKSFPKSSEIKASVLKVNLEKSIYGIGNDDDDDDDDDNHEEDDDDEENVYGEKSTKVYDKKKNLLESKHKMIDVKKPISKISVKKIEIHKDGDDNDYDVEKRTEQVFKAGINTKSNAKVLFRDDDDNDEDDGDDDNEANKDKNRNYQIKSKVQPATFQKTESKTKAEFKSKLLQETKKTRLLSTESFGDDDDDASVEDDDNDDEDEIPKDKINSKMIAKYDTVDEKETSKKSSLTKEAKTVDPITKPIPSESNKIETNKKILKSEAKSDNIIEKLKDKPKTNKAEHPIPLKEVIKESKTIDNKPKKESTKKEYEKTKSSREKDDKSSSHEVFIKSETRPKKMDDPKNEFKSSEFKKTTADFEKHSIDKTIHKTSKEKLVDSQEAESHLKYVTDALHRRNLLKSEFEDLYAFLPTFAPNFSRIHNPECRRHGQIVLRQLRGTKLWALNMLDATAKIPSGILQGNGIQLGDFDQCLGSRARVQLETGSLVRVQGKYCLARLEVKAEHPDLEVPVHLAQAKNLVRSRIDDPGHFVPRFSTLSWGVCVPAACDPEDAEVILKDALKHYQHTSGVVLRVKVDEQDCHVEDGAEWWKKWVELPTALTLSFYGVIILLVLVATVQDCISRGSEEQSEEANEKVECEKESKVKEKEGGEKKCNSFLSNFSLYYTIGKLVAPGSAEEIPSIHGIRGIATIALLIAHKFIPVAVTPYTNRLKLTEVVSAPIWSWSRAGWMYTDCFLLLSGALTAHRISADKEAGAPKRLFLRYLRLTPALLGVVLFYAYIWDNISSGPMWGTLVTKNAKICQEGWWWNLLYIQNYFGLEDMCAPQTHQLALDMQLTILGCIIVWVVQVRSGLAKILLPALHIIAAYSRYTTVRDHRLTMLVYHGVSVSQLYRTARLSYTSTLHRSTAYLIGLSLGLALRNTAKHGKILLALGWLYSGALWCLVWWAGFDSGSTQYRYSASFAAQYAALAPIATALAIAWVIYAVHSGKSGFLSRFLCCRPLVLISRLSYALYLCQFIVFITNVATTRTSTEFSIISLIDVQEISAILLSSTILTLTLVIPMQSLHKVFSFPNKTKSVEDIKESEDKKSVKQENHVNHKEEETIEVPQIRSRQHLIAHREVLEEIPETEIEYESQRDHEGLGEILEEEEDEEFGEESQMQDEELEVIEEEGGEEEESWMEREEYLPRRSYSNEEDQDLDEWEWTANGSRNGAQYSRYSR